MNLFDLFKPKYKSKNWEVRKEAVKKLRNNKILNDIASNDENWEVRKCAYEKLGHDQLALAELLINETFSPTNIPAIEIDDQDLLIKILRETKSDLVRTKTAEKIEDWETRKSVYEEIGHHQLALAENLINDSFLLTIIPTIEIDSQDLLIKILREAESDEVKAKVIEKINSKKLLKDLTTSKSWMVRRASFKKLGNNKEALIEELLYFKYSYPWDIPKITLDNQDLLFKIFKNAEDPEVRIKAVEKIIEKTVSVEKQTEIDEILKQMVKNETSLSVRCGALKNIQDDDFLIKFAKSNESAYVRKDAVKRIDNQDILIEILDNDKDSEVRIAALEKIENKEIIVNTLKNDKDFKIRSAALNIINDNDILFEMAFADDDWTFRKVILDKFSLNQLESYLKKDITNNEENLKILKAKEYFEFTPVIPKDSFHYVEQNDYAFFTQLELEYLKELKQKSEETITQELLDMWNQSYMWGELNKFPQFEEYPDYPKARAIGYELWKRGGIELMRKVYLKVKNRTDRCSEFWWHGIGIWRA